MSDLALKLIAENKKTHAPFLDLGNCGLTAVPAELGELVWLEELSFASEWEYYEENTWIGRKSQNSGDKNNLAFLTPAFPTRQRIVNFFKQHNINPFANLVNLRHLYFSHVYENAMNFSDLSALARLSGLQRLIIPSSQVSDLRPLAELSSLKQLDISYTQVSDLTSLARLPNLQQLNVLRTQVSDLSPLTRLYGLKNVNLAGTKVSDLMPLAGLYDLQILDAAGTQVSDLSSLEGLSRLEQLDVLGTQVSDLTPLKGLSRLQQLNVSDTQIYDLSPLEGLSSLQELKVWGTQVFELTPLAELSDLQRINLSATQVSDLTPLKGLSGLQMLDISNTQVCDLFPLIALAKRGLAIRWSSDSYENEGVFIENCPLKNPPVEIGQRGYAAILNFFAEQATQGTDKLYEAKMLIIGEGGAGKTSLLRRLYQGDKDLPDEQESTKGIDICQHSFQLGNGRRFQLNVWDFGGQEIYHATHQFFLTKRSLYVLLDDTRKDDKTVHDPSFKYWLDIADLLGDHSPLLIFQNEKGGRSKTIDESGIKAKFNNVKDVFRGNLEHTGSADALAKAIEYHVQSLPHIGEALPAKWIAIRADIEELAKEKSFISLQNYFDIYQKHLTFDRNKALHLSRYLHDLGVFLHFQDEPLLARTVILQNTWATEAVFKLLDDETVKQKLGHFDRADCQRVWQDSMFADMHPELLALMQKFELCYPLPDSQGEQWLAPQLLAPSKPSDLADWGQANDLTLRYRYQFLPKGMISRLMVRMHRFVQRPQLSWVNGALFERGDTEVLVEVADKGCEIVLRARGAERKELLTVIAADLDALNEHFHGLKDLVAKWVPCLCSRCVTTSEPEFFEQKRLLQRKKDGKLKVECPASYEEVDVLELLDGIRIDQLPIWAKEDSLATLLSEKENKDQTIKIFLASSAELREDRDAFDLYFRQQNDKLRKQGIYLEIVRWENFLDAMSETRLQDEYNREVKACDIFVSLFFTKTGKFTEEEFDTAHQQFLTAKKPQIYTFFKNAPQNMGDIGDEIISLLNFKKKLAALGHFFTSYDNIEHLKRQFKDQLEKLRDLDTNKD